MPAAARFPVQILDESEAAPVPSQPLSHLSAVRQFCLTFLLIDCQGFRDSAIHMPCACHLSLVHTSQTDHSCTARLRGAAALQCLVLLFYFLLPQPFWPERPIAGRVSWRMSSSQGLVGDASADGIVVDRPPLPKRRWRAGWATLRQETPLRCCRCVWVSAALGAMRFARLLRAASERTARASAADTIRLARIPRTWQAGCVLIASLFAASAI